MSKYKKRRYTIHHVKPTACDIRQIVSWWIFSYIYYYLCNMKYSLYSLYTRHGTYGTLAISIHDQKKSNLPSMWCHRPFSGFYFPESNFDISVKRKIQRSHSFRLLLPKECFGEINNGKMQINAIIIFFLVYCRINRYRWCKKKTKTNFGILNNH